ncbi:MAG: hypothetical protein WDN47_04515 [Candidatus Doudnabacteria bacterium]
MSDPSNLATREDAARIFGVSLRELSELIAPASLTGPCLTLTKPSWS